MKTKFITYKINNDFFELDFNNYIEEEKEMAPATQPVMGGELQAVGVTIKDRTCVKLRPVMPQNFLIDPVQSQCLSLLDQSGSSVA